MALLNHRDFVDRTSLRHQAGVHEYAAVERGERRRAFLVIADDPADQRSRQAVLDRLVDFLPDAWPSTVINEIGRDAAWFAVVDPAGVRDGCAAREIARRTAEQALGTAQPAAGPGPAGRRWPRRTRRLLVLALIVGVLAVTGPPVLRGCGIIGIRWQRPAPVDRLPQPPFLTDRATESSGPGTGASSPAPSR